MPSTPPPTALTYRACRNGCGLCATDGTRGLCRNCVRSSRVRALYPSTVPRDRMGPELEAQIRAAHAAGMTDSQAAVHLNRHQASISRWRRQLGLPRQAKLPMGQSVRPVAEWTPSATPPAGEHCRELAIAGWPWPIPGLPPDLLPIHARILVHLADGPTTLKAILIHLGRSTHHDQILRYVGSNAQSDVVGELAAAGLVVRLLRYRRGRDHGRLADLLVLSEAGMSLLQRAAEEVARCSQ